MREPTVGGMTLVQGTFDDLGTPLSSVTFVVVDLETTGGSPAECGITEIGAVKVCGGEVVGEFQTLVNPGGPIPTFISVLIPLVIMVGLQRYFVRGILGGAVKG